MKYTGIPKKTPLYEAHLLLGARMVDFSGWLLPVQYSGIIKEHLHTREKCSVFDICHMGEFIIEGKSAQAELSAILSCDASALAVNRCKYCFILNEKGCFIDDAVLFKLGPESFMLVVNAGHTDADLEWISEKLSADCIITDISSETAKIDFQGPSSLQVASHLFDGFDFSSMRRFSFTSLSYRGFDVICSLTGYTGEAGLEFFLPSESARVLWDDIMECEDVLPAGLGARDSLRLEMGYSLYGHDITETINPFEAGLGRFIDLTLDFNGAESLRRIKDAGIERLLVPFICEGRRSARDEYTVVKNDKKIGIVTSGAFSPVLKKGIGLCLVDIEYSTAGTEIVCRSGDIEINAVITKLPFV